MDWKYFPTCVCNIKTIQDIIKFQRTKNKF